MIGSKQTEFVIAAARGQERPSKNAAGWHGRLAGANRNASKKRPCRLVEATQVRTLLSRDFAV
jgi:hypothetical protein